MSLAESAKSQLFDETEGVVFAVLDGCSIPGLLEGLYRHQPEHECLYRGELKPDMAEAAPYLVQLEQDSEFSDWVLEQGWGEHWGVFATGNVSLHGMRQHFRKFLVVHDDQRQPVFFRYYDPRVLRVYLPTCNPEELAMVFGPVASFLLEDEKPDTMLVYRLVAGSLKVEKRRLVS